jgi:flagellar basal body-associated protein FliL
MRSVHRAVLLAILALTFTPARAEDGDADKKGSTHKVTQSKSYLMVEPIYATIVSGDRPVGLLMIGVGIDVPDEKLRAEADHAMPVLRDAYVRNMMAFAATQVRTFRQPDVAVIADRLQGVTDRALGRKGARLLLAQVAMRLDH